MKTIIEQIEEYDFICDTHGKLENDELTLSFDGLIVCGFCSINQEMDVKNEHDIDCSISVEI